MEIHGDAVARFIFQQRSTLRFINSFEAANESYYVVMAHIYGIVSTSPFGVDLAVADHTGKSMFALRGTPGGEFFEKHMFRYADHEPIIDPYALDDEWEQSYLFKISKVQQTSVLGHNAFIVNDICMVKPIVDQFAVYKMNPEEQQVYVQAISTIVRREFPTTIGLLSTTDFNAIHPNVDVGFKKRIYAPFQI